MSNESPDLLLSDAELTSLLQKSKSVAVIGVSAKEDRASHHVAKFLIQKTRLEVYLVNPMLDELWGKRVYHSLAELVAEVGSTIDIIDAFRKSEDIPEVMDEALAAGAKVLWMQLGIRNSDEAERGRAAGVEVIQNRCLKIEMQRLGV